MRITAPGLLLVALLTAGEAFTAEPAPAESAVPGPSARADRIVLEDVYRQSGAARTVPGPSWMDYVSDVLSRAAGSLFRRLDPLGQLVGPWSHIFAVILAGALLLSFLVILGRVFAKRGPPAEPAAAVQTSLPFPAPARGREEWRLEFEERLGRGETLPALQALWWWFALSASPEGVDPAWTSREVLVRAGRDELVPVARVLDRMIYGPLPPREPEVRALLAEMEGAFA